MDDLSRSTDHRHAAPTRPTRPADQHSGLADLLRRWVPQQRWYPAKGTAHEPRHLRAVDLPHPAVTVQVHLLGLPSGGVLQVPVVVRPDTGDGRPPGTIGHLGDGGERVVVVDGCHDPSFVDAWLRTATRDEGVDLGGSLDGMRVVAGEQSNTSVLLPGLEPPAILKVFRGVSTGQNPDVEVPLALTRAGWDGVPRPLAWWLAELPAPSGTREPGGPRTGHLGVLSELVVGAEDGFEMACRWAADGRDLGGPARALGATTAQMHAALRRALPLPEDSEPDESHETHERAERAQQVVRVLRARARAAVDAAPGLAERADRVDEVLAAVGEVPVPALQRVHGDYHLGQVLHSPRGWSVLDFEGEPQASEAERTRPDVALRDLAGMLRSLDYAAAVGGATDPAWLPSARAALVAGYREATADTSEAGAERSGAADDVLLRALELDKALYEVVYETRNRPTWVPIPLAAVDRLLASATTA